MAKCRRHGCVRTEILCKIVWSRTSGLSWRPFSCQISGFCVAATFCPLDGNCKKEQKIKELRKAGQVSKRCQFLMSQHCQNASLLGSIFTSPRILVWLRDNFGGIYHNKIQGDLFSISMWAFNSSMVLTPNPDYKIFPARRVKKLFREPERAPKMVQKHRKSLPNG